MDNNDTKSNERGSSNNHLIKIESSKTATAGIPIDVQVTYNMGAINDSSSNILGANLHLLSKRPCKKVFTIAQHNVFSEGVFEAGEYVRYRNLPITNLVVPTVDVRGITYGVNAEINIKNNGEMNFFEEIPIEIKAAASSKRTPHKVDINVQGIRIQMYTDQFKEDSDISMRYELDQIKELKVNLIQSSKFTCKCKDANVCVFNKPKAPSEVLSKVIKDPPSSGLLTFKVPKFIEFRKEHSYIVLFQLNCTINFSCTLA